MAESLESELARGVVLWVKDLMDGCFGIFRDALAWAESTFEGSTLPDRRLRKRLIRYAASQALHPRASTAKACASEAEREGAYRLLENGRVRAQDILEGPIRDTVRRSQGMRYVLAVQDTSSVEVKHQPLREALQEEGSPTGWHTHVTLAVDPVRGQPLGLLGQYNWIRDPLHERRRASQTNPEAPKESERWSAAACDMHHLYEGSGTRVITVADREADIYDLMAEHCARDQGFVLRAKHARQVIGSSQQGEDYLARDLHDALDVAPVLGHRRVDVAQRGGQKAGNGQKARPARKAGQYTTEVQACSLRIQRPKSGRADSPESLPVTVVRVRSRELDEKGRPLLQWILLTSEPVSTLEDAILVVRMYELRWLIEEFFKAYKTGCRLEERPLQSVDNVERLMAIVAPIAVQLLTVRQLAQHDVEGPQQPCDQVLDDAQWQCLWLLDQPNKPLPMKPPSIQWAYLAIAKMGGFYDSKRTGRAGWETLWSGMQRLNDYVVGFRLAKVAVERQEI